MGILEFYTTNENTTIFVGQEFVFNKTVGPLSKQSFTLSQNSFLVLEIST